MDPMFVYLSVLLLILTHWNSYTSSFIIIRRNDGDTIICNKTVDCSILDAEQVLNKTCLCKEGTFRGIIKGNLKCQNNKKAASECFYPKEMVTIPINRSTAGGFSQRFYTKCNSMRITSLFVISKIMEWKQENTYDFKISKTVRGYYLKWRTPNNINATKYSGQLIKMIISCGHKSREYCFIGKIPGKKTWNPHDLSTDVCQGRSQTTADPVIIKPITSTPKVSIYTTRVIKIATATDVTTTSSISSSNKDKIVDNKMKNICLIVGIIAAIVILILVGVIIYLCKKQSSTPDKTYKKPEVVEKTEKPKDETTLL